MSTPEHGEEEQDTTTTTHFEQIMPPIEEGEVTMDAVLHDVDDVTTSQLSPQPEIFPIDMSIENTTALDSLVETLLANGQLQVSQPNPQTNNTTSQPPAAPATSASAGFTSAVAAQFDVDEANEIFSHVLNPPNDILDHDSDDEMPDLEDAPPGWQPPHPSTSTDIAIWSSPDDPPPLQPLHPVLSDTSLPAFEHATAGLEATSIEATSAWDEEASFTVVGDPESGEVLPNSIDLFSIPQNPALQNNSLEPGDRLNNPNPQVELMFAFWRKMYEEGKPGYPEISKYAPPLEPFRLSRWARPTKILPEHIKAKDDSSQDMDFQGIYWNRYKTNKTEARGVRRMTYFNYTNLEHHATHYQNEIGTPEFKLSFPIAGAPALPNIEHRYRFRATHTAIIPQWRHYQLRHNIFATSQNAVYFHTSSLYSPAFLDPTNSFLTRSWQVSCYNPNTCTRTSVMEAKRNRDDPKLENISTLSADHDTLVVGSTSGVYGFRSLLTPSSAPYTVGNITPGVDGFGDNSTNHVYTHLSRSSSSPLAAFSSNDLYIRTLDVRTNTWILRHKFNNPVNCAASSPDTRLRLLVSDDLDPLIVDAETGEQHHRLPGHMDHGFACAWAPDGYTLATAHQDGLTQIYDARQPNKILKRIPSEQACVRSLQFSPLGAGPPVLIAAEPADFVHIIDADTFETKQTIDFFGDIAGASLTPDGETLWVGCADPGFGGLMEFQRQGWGGWGTKRRRKRRDSDVDWTSMMKNRIADGEPRTRGVSGKKVLSEGELQNRDGDSVMDEDHDREGDDDDNDDEDDEETRENELLPGDLVWDDEELDFGHSGNFELVLNEGQRSRDRRLGKALAGADAMGGSGGHEGGSGENGGKGGNEGGSGENGGGSSASAANDDANALTLRRDGRPKDGDWLPGSDRGEGWSRRKSRQGMGIELGKLLLC